MENTPIYNNSVQNNEEPKSNTRKQRAFTCAPILQKKGTLDYDLQVLNIISRHFYRMQTKPSRFIFSISTGSKEGLPFYAFFLEKIIYAKSMANMVSKMKEVVMKEYNSTYTEVEDLVLSEVTFAKPEKSSKPTPKSLIQQLMNMSDEEKELLKNLLNK